MNKITYLDSFKCFHMHVIYVKRKIQIEDADLSILYKLSLFALFSRFGIHFLVDSDFISNK